MTDDRARNVRKQVAACIRQFLTGNVSCDHLIEEFKESGDPAIREIIGIIEKETKSMDRYERAEQAEPAFRDAMERLIRKLEEG